MGDIHFDKVAVLAHFDGANGDTVSSDTSPNPKTMTFIGGAALSSAQSKFGGTSLSLSGSGQYVSIPNGADFSFIAADGFTVEAQVYCTDYSSGDQTIACHAGTPWDYGGSFALYCNSSYISALVYTDWGSEYCDSVSVSPALNTMTSVSLSVGGGYIRIFMEGTEVGSVALNGSVLSPCTAPEVLIGANQNPGNNSKNTFFSGFIDEFRITSVSRYSASYTPQAVAFPDVAELPNSGVCSVSVPMVTVDLSSTIQPYAFISLPNPSLVNTSGSAVFLGMPALSARSVAHDSSGERSMEASLPALSAIVTSGGNAVLRTPSLRSSAFGVGVRLAELDTRLPALMAAASGKVSGMLSAGVVLPAISASGHAGVVCSITVGGLTTQATGTSGSMGRSQFTLPLFSIDASATLDNHGQSNITLPSLSMSTGEIVNVMLPGLSVSAIGTSTITATYEAYSLNLNHSAQAGVDAIDEMTRYTNFPFTHVVRYKNSYYGANSTGLYLLEGTTDAGTAIQFDVQTGTTDFKLSEKKTVAAAYFSGRFGPDSTISLNSGEKTPNTYSFSTPRGSTAQNHRQVFGKGVKERFHSLRITGIGECEIDTIELDVHKTSRRI